MKKYAFMVVELIVAITLMAFISIICINTFRNTVIKDTDIIKFRYAYGTVAEAISELRNDLTMYPSKDTLFADMSERSYSGETKVYGGTTKFQKLFKSKFNVFDNNISFVPERTSNITDVSNNIPYVRYYNSATGEELYTHSNGLEIKCFMENKGIVYCPPEIEKKSITPTHIYIPIYVNKFNVNSSKTTSIEKMIVLEVSKSGKIDIPVTIKSGNGSNDILIDCHNKSFNGYNQCRAIEKLADMDF